MNTYIAEITDLFGGELNYSHITRLSVKANNERGAVNKIGRYCNLSFTKQFGNADLDCAVYHSNSKLTGYTLELADEYNKQGSEIEI